MKNFLSKNLSIFILFLILTITIFILDENDILNNIKSGVLRITAPFLKASHQVDVKVARPLYNFLEFQKKIDLINTFEKQKTILVGLQAELDKLKEENEFLKNALNFKKANPYDFKVARVIGKANEAGQVLLIDLGKKDQMQENDIVVLPNNFLIGRVNEVFETISQVTTLFNDDFSVAVKGQESKAQGLLTGKNNILQVEIINYEDHPQEKENFLTSGINGVFPPNFLVGQAIEISTKPVEISKIITLKSFIDIETIEKVLVISK
jgi:rod shape-determining protein MreC